MKRKMSYKKLWKLLIDRDMNRTDLHKDAGISSSSLAKLGKDYSARMPSIKIKND